LGHLRTIFDILRKSGLTINVGKCQFVKKEVLYLGYTVNKNGYQPPKDRVEAITSNPKPETITDLRRFLGMLN
ncbi:hypothetical protein NL492_26890, partial [Klebsiella pneumoniae]|nr:hypothetical protein [Klebsiella pneumoniae]